ncbi:MAG: TRAP transporter substrate-binding protein DctP, partial [Alphaproteobacteria bacterium]|nr:TRAP transporter substrate-binding protein DctP [Alphaproteobacteria bacterium]
NRDMIERIGMQDAAVAAKAAEKGIELVRWSAEERRKFREVAAGVWAEYAARSEMAQRIYDSHIAFLERLGLL